jgi:hypothetical protein
MAGHLVNQVLVAMRRRQPVSRVTLQASMLAAHHQRDWHSAARNGLAHAGLYRGRLSVLLAHVFTLVSAQQHAGRV